LIFANALYKKANIQKQKTTIMNLARSKKEILEMKDDEDDFLLDSMSQIK
jgi:hypothetical protein